MFNFRQALFAGLAVSLISFTSLAIADDWVATKLRGTVLQFVDRQWQPLKRGDIVPDSRFVRTAPNGMVELTRGAETVSLDPNSQVRIFDKGGAKPYTTFKQDFGIVSVEAEVRDVQHFAVVTPFLAAVVKGTRFVVARAVPPPGSRFAAAMSRWRTPTSTPASCWRLASPPRWTCARGRA